MGDNVTKLIICTVLGIGILFGYEHYLGKSEEAKTQQRNFQREQTRVTLQKLVWNTDFQWKKEKERLAAECLSSQDSLSNYLNRVEAIDQKYDLSKERVLRLLVGFEHNPYPL